jgi:hypothetical protein
MKKQLFLLIVILFSNSIFCQSYLGMITKQVNFREGSSTDESIIGSLKPNTQIFIISLETENDFYNIIDIATDNEGYVHKSFVKVGKLVNKSNGSFISASGNSSSYDSEAKIFNNTSITMTLKLNEIAYRFSPKETKNITLTPGDYDFRASAPGVMPKVGRKDFENNRIYTWQFYIVTSKQ